MKKIVLFIFVILSVNAFAQTPGKVKKHQWRDKIRENPVGVWEFYDYAGNLEQTYDFTTHSLIFHAPDPGIDTINYRVIKGAEVILTKLDSPPVIIGGSSVYSSTMVNFRYPAAARENNIQGKVTILITINEQGQATDYQVKKSLGYGIDEEAIKTLKKLPYGFAPGILNGQKVVTEYEVKVSLRLN